MNPPSIWQSRLPAASAASDDDSCATSVRWAFATSAMLRRSASRDLAALALIASGVSVEDATRFLIRLGDDTAHSVQRIFALVELMRLARPATAYRLAMQIAGASAAPQQRKGQHQPAMDPSGTPARPASARPEAQPSMTEIMGRIGARRDRG